MFTEKLLVSDIIFIAGLNTSVNRKWYNFTVCRRLKKGATGKSWHITAFFS